MVAVKEAIAAQVEKYNSKITHPILGSIYKYTRADFQSENP